LLELRIADNASDQPGLWRHSLLDVVPILSSFYSPT
jgi:hypothetical protein